MKKLIIVGATSGIGKELALLYVKAGDKIGITGRRTHLLNEFKQQYPEQIITAGFDVRGNENIEHIETLIHKLGGLDLLIYNSGFGDVSDSLDWELDKKTFETNVKGFIEIVNYAFNYFVKQGHGQIAGISSIASIRGNHLAPAYSASKAFMSVYMEGLHIKAKRIQQKNSGVNIAITDIQPGFVQSSMAKAKQQFWVAPVKKAAQQIFNAIEKKKWRVYVTKRWWLIAKLLKWVPASLYHRVG